jgi:hypothetical protein
MARRPRAVRPGALLLPGRLCGGADHAHARSHRCTAADLDRRHQRRLGRPGHRLPFGALSRNLFRHAQPRSVDDPVRRAGEDRVARLDRRFQRIDADLPRLCAAPRGAGAFALLADARRRRRLCGHDRRLFPHRRRCAGGADPRQRNPRRIPRRFGEPHHPHQGGDRRHSRRPGRRAGRHVDRSRRPQHGLLDDIGQFCLRHHFGGIGLRRRRLCRLARLRGGAVLRLLLTILFLPDGLGSLVSRLRRRGEAKP